MVVGVKIVLSRSATFAILFFFCWCAADTFVLFLIFSLFLYVVLGGTGSDTLLLLDNDEGEEDKDDGGRDANGDSHCDSPVLLL